MVATQRNGGDVSESAVAAIEVTVLSCSDNIAPSSHAHGLDVIIEPDDYIESD